MASISFDGHSFFIEGRRVWLVSGVLDYARIPRDLWRRRIRAAKHAGLNCLAVSVMWNVHEPQPGVFRFDGRADLKHFIRLIAEEGLYCILRPGPFVGGGWDAGGLPPWLSEKGSIKPNVGSGALNPSARVRQASPVFLQAVARYLDAVMDRVKDLQVTAAKRGPIVLVQVEHEWFSHNPQQAEGYLEQLTRFLRESGCNVPLVNTNNLWQQVPGTIDGWDGDENVFTNCRQLRSLRHDAPCMVMSLPTGDRATWGAERPRTRTAATLVRRMAEVSAAGGMFNLDPFCGGTNFGFYAGRFVGNDNRFAITSRDGDGPLSEAGGKREKYLGVKRLATFLSQFEHVMGNLTLNHQPTVSATHLSVIHQSGTQGHVVFVIRDDPADAATRHVELSTPDGQSLPVDMGDDNVAWVLLGANIDGAMRLDLTNLRPWAFIDNRLLVMYGPAGSDGLFSIDGVLRTVTVPSAGGEPLVISHDGLQIAILNETQIDAAYLSAAGLHVGVAGLDDDDQPIPHRDFATAYLVTSAGKVTRAKLKTNGGKPPALPKLTEWQFAVMDSYADGSSPRFATLDGPRSLEACGADFGYGWYRVKLNRKKSGRANLLIPRGGDRLHLYQEGKLQSIIGVGPGADNEPLAVNLAGKDAELVFLADNLGRFSEDLLVDQPRGIYGDLFDVKPLKLPRPEVTSDPRIDPFQLNGYVPGCSADERGPYPRYHFPVKLTSIKAKLVLVLHGERPRSVVLVNDKPVAIDLGNGVTAHHLLDAELKRGTNRITLALIDRPGEGDDARLRAAATLYDVKETLTDGADWWYARWQMPDDAAYQAVSRATPNLPTFFRTRFRVDAAPPARPVMLDLTGASKGQLYLNGHNAGRYFIATSTGRKVAPQKRYYLPEPWLKAGDNELVLFDEHGKSPAGSKLVYDDYGPFGE